MVHQQFPKMITVLLSGQSNNAAIERTRGNANLHAYIPKLWDEATLLRGIMSGLGVMA